MKNKIRVVWGAPIPNDKEIIDDMIKRKEIKFPLTRSGIYKAMKRKKEIIKKIKVPKLWNPKPSPSNPLALYMEVETEEEAFKILNS